MNRPLKYIIVLDRGCELPIIFNNIIDHATVAGNQAVLAAGFLYLDVKDGKIQASCYGESTTLRKNCRPEEDDRLINKTINSCTG